MLRQIAARNKIPVSEDSIRMIRNSGKEILNKVLVSLEFFILDILILHRQVISIVYHEQPSEYFSVERNHR